MKEAKKREKDVRERREMKIENESNDLPPLGVIIQGSDDDNDLIQFRKCIRSSLFGLLIRGSVCVCVCVCTDRQLTNKQQHTFALNPSNNLFGIFKVCFFSRMVICERNTKCTHTENCVCVCLCAQRA